MQLDTRNRKSHFAVVMPQASSYPEGSVRVTAVGGEEDSAFLKPLMRLQAERQFLMQQPIDPVAYKDVIAVRF